MLAFVLALVLLHAPLFYPIIHTPCVSSSLHHELNGIRTNLGACFRPLWTSNGLACCLAYWLLDFFCYTTLVRLLVCCLIAGFPICCGVTGWLSKPITSQESSGRFIAANQSMARNPTRLTTALLGPASSSSSTKRSSSSSCRCQSR